MMMFIWGFNVGKRSYIEEFMTVLIFYEVNEKWRCFITFQGIWLVSKMYVDSLA